MKKLIFICLLAASTTGSQAQNSKVDPSGNYTAIPAKSTEAKQTGKTFTTRTGEIYPVMESKNGKLYYVKTSKTGNEYKVYLKLEN